jgi:hypothetical protein
VFAGIARRHGIPETRSAKRKKGEKYALTKFENNLKLVSTKFEVTKLEKQHIASIV